MERTELVWTISERTDTGERAAEEAIDAVLSTLGERLSEDQARDLAAQLPGGPPRLGATVPGGGVRLPGRPAH